MLHLASQSPRRRELLARFGLPFGVLDLDIPEHPLPGEPPEEYVRRVAREKAGAGLLRVVGQPGAVVLAADTEVILGERIYGKPRDADDARDMLASLASRTHLVVTAVWLVSAAREVQAVNRSEVTFGPIDAREMDAYLASGEWQGKAGGYGIQGLAGALIPWISGSFTGIMGLPVAETAALLTAIGYPVWRQE